MIDLELLPRKQNNSIPTPNVITLFSIKLSSYIKPPANPNGEFGVIYTVDNNILLAAPYSELIKWASIDKYDNGVLKSIKLSDGMELDMNCVYVCDIIRLVCIQFGIVTKPLIENGFLKSIQYVGVTGIYLTFTNLTIENDAGYKKILEEVTVKFGINVGTNNAIYFNGVNYTVPKDKINLFNTYGGVFFITPHIQANVDSFGLGSGSVCYGKTGIDKTYFSTGIKPTVDNLRMFIYKMKQYLTFESSDGVPYLHTRDWMKNELIDIANNNNKKIKYAELYQNGTLQILKEYLTKFATSYTSMSSKEKSNAKDAKLIFTYEGKDYYIRFGNIELELNSIEDGDTLDKLLTKVRKTTNYKEEYDDIIRNNYEIYSKTNNTIDNIGILLRNASNDVQVVEEIMKRVALKKIRKVAENNIRVSNTITTKNIVLIRYV